MDILDVRDLQAELDASAWPSNARRVDLFSSLSLDSLRSVTNIRL